MEKDMKADQVGQWKKSALRSSLIGAGFLLFIVVGLFGAPFHREGINDPAAAQEGRESMSIADSGLAKAEAKPWVPTEEPAGLETATFALG
jgi:hypothetical protein